MSGRQKQRYDKRRPSYPPDIAKQVESNIDLILNCKKENMLKFIELADHFGNFLANGKEIKTAQVRKIYSELQKIDSFDKEEHLMKLHMLRPQLAYAKGRHKNLHELQKILDQMIVAIKNDEQLGNFKNFFEAILAYHKAHGGGE